MSENHLRKVGRVWSVTVFPTDVEEKWPQHGYPESMNTVVEKLMTMSSAERSYDTPDHPWPVHELDVRTPQGGVMVLQQESCPTTDKLHYQVGIRMAKPTRGSFIKKLFLVSKL